MDMIKQWAEEDAREYGKKVMIVEHAMAETGLFTDEALAEMLDNHPNHLIDFQYVVDEPGHPDRQVTVDFSGADGKTMVEAAKSDLPIWINVREVMNRQPKYKKVMDQLHRELEKYTGKNNDRANCRGGVLISSKSARTPYHADPTMTHLWHIRGHKRVWVYPINDQTLPETEVEEILLHDHNDDVPYNEQMDEQALVIDMQPGMAATWPLHAPHRVMNQGDLNVSLTIEWSPMQTIIQNGAQITNGILRRRLGLNPQIESQGKINRFIRFAASRVLRKMKLVEGKSPQKEGYQFNVDLDNNTGVAEFEKTSNKAA